MNVQVASGCIKKWYESTLGVSRCHSEVLVRQGNAAMPLAVVDETTTSKSGIKTAFLGIFPNASTPLFGDLRMIEAWVQSMWRQY